MPKQTASQSAAATAPDANQFGNLPDATQAYLRGMRSDFATPGTRLGHLARRFAIAARDLQDAIDTYGTPVVTASILGSKVTAPVTIVANLGLTVTVDGDVHEYGVVLHPNEAPAPSVAPRPEARLDGFAASTMTG